MRDASSCSLSPGRSTRRCLDRRLARTSSALVVPWADHPAHDRRPWNHWPAFVANWRAAEWRTTRVDDLAIVRLRSSSSRERGGGMLRWHHAVATARTARVRTCVMQLLLLAHAMRS